MCVEKLRWIRPFCNEEKDNLEGSFISHLFQFVESRLTLCVYEDLQSAGFEVAALIFDGLHPQTLTLLIHSTFSTARTARARALRPAST